MRDFIEKMGFDTDQTPTGTFLRNRGHHINEELEEYWEAVASNDYEEIADALGDIAYLAIGALDMLGLDFDAIFDEIHQANMEKKRCRTPEESPRGKLPDARKPHGWEPPCIAAHVPPGKLDPKRPLAAERRMNLSNF